MGFTKVYVITNIQDDPYKVYVGITHRSTDLRKKEHSYRLGKNIKFSYIDEIDSDRKEDYKPLESFWIEQFRQWGFNLINKNSGGAGPRYHRDDIKVIIGANNKWKKVCKYCGEEIGNRNLNRHQLSCKKNPDKVHKKFPQRGRSGSENGWSKPVAQIDPKTGKVIKTFSSGGEAARELGISLGGISDVCVGRQYTSGGYKWKRV